MNKLQLKNIYYRKNQEIEEYRDIFIETNKGVLEAGALLDLVEEEGLLSMTRLEKLDILKKTYGELYINEARRTYDNDLYFLISDSFLLVIEYVLTSTSKLSIQEFRLIEDIHSTNQNELLGFKEMDLIDLTF
jgi:hypothetical protein